MGSATEPGNDRSQSRTPNLDALVEAGFVEKGEIDRRTNRYGLTSSARAMVRERVQRLAGAFEVTSVAADGGESA